MSFAVAVLGAGAPIGRAIVRDLAESPEVSRLLLLDRDGPAAAGAATEHAPGTGEALAVDAPEGLAAAIAGCQVLVNAAGYRINLEAMEAALEAGCHYVDLGGLYGMTGRQLELDERFIAAELLAVLGVGASPGTTNVMAEMAARALGERVEEIHVSVAGRDPAGGDGIRLAYSLPTLIDELTMAPIVLDKGAARELAPLSPGGSVTFPEPVGRAQTVYALHSELQTFGRSFGVVRASYRLSLPSALLGQIEALLDADEDELAAAAAAVLPPSDQTVAAHVVEARSAGRVARVSALTGPREEWGFGGGVVAAAAPAAAVVRLIARGRIDTVGVLAPEMCVDPDDLMPELEGRGCAFTLELADRRPPG
ncbi:MAG: saccharopine dehydrogenase family protein [Solirubrobacteraceae bacterium]